MLAFFLTSLAVCASELPLRILSWNVHWQCGSDHIPGCRAAATQRFVDLARTADASIVLSVELEQTSSTPVDLPSHGLGSKWAAVNGSCAPLPPATTGDACALNFAPGYRVLASGGGCLGGDSGRGYSADARAFAVARVAPPGPVAGCPGGLCVIGLHSPHINITAGADTVARVCGGGRPECTVAMGDWNAPVAKRVFNPYTVSDRWAQLVGTPPAFSVAAPDVNSCCYPEVKYSGVDDHVVTDVPGARATEALLPYQMKDFSSDTEEHMPLLVNLTLPVAA